MAVNASTFGPKPAFSLANGLPAVGNLLFFFVAGSVNTKLATFTDSTGTAANPNPIILDVLGQTPNGLFFTNGVAYKVVYAPAGDFDPPTSPIWTLDNLRGQGDTSAVLDQWQSTGFSPTFISTTSFSVPGDQRSILEVGRRIKTTNTSGTIYSTIQSSVFTTLTTITVSSDSGVLDSGLSAVSYSLLTASNSAIPYLGYVPPGVMIDFAGPSIPLGWMGCDGANFSRVDDVALYSAIGTTWGVGDGVTTAGLPDTRRRVAMGSGGTGTGIIGNAVGNTGGAETHALAGSENGPHTHTYAACDPNDGTVQFASAAGNFGTPQNGLITGSSGSGLPHNIIQSAYIVTRIIKR